MSYCKLTLTVEKASIGLFVSLSQSFPPSSHDYLLSIRRAGGFAIQGQGGLLIKSIDGDYNNIVGFPGQAFFEWLSELADQGELLTMD